MTEIEFGSKRIPFERKPAKSAKYVTIRVSPNKTVTVLASHDIDDRVLASLISSKGEWVLEKFQRIDDGAKRNFAREFVSGEGFPFKGKLLRLKVLRLQRPGENRVYSDTTTLFCEIDSLVAADIEAAVVQWYKDEARNYLPSRAQRFAKRLSVKPNAIEIRDQTRRWGSCTKDGRVLLNWRIIMAPPSIIDYVLVHELSHLKANLHTPEFWNWVKAVLPDFDARKKWLRVNGALLSL